MHKSASIPAPTVLRVYSLDGMSFTVLQQYFAICYRSFSTLLLTSKPLLKLCPFLKCHSLTTASMRRRQVSKTLKPVLTSGHHRSSLSFVTLLCKHDTHYSQKGH
ncbi:hypothetical protein XENOCAPTIV_023044 [Xenoophorus captivus]|uniref:Uncharacterized protein n=1 Tax=Xenoophorus captivus TaxID=1517983 RepID=A0ABV0QWC3_9TELE